MLSKEQTSANFEFPVYSSDSNNNGIIGFTEKPEFICDNETPVYVIFGDHTRTFNIAQKSFSVLDNVKVLVPCTDNIKSLLFIVACWKKQIPNLGYSRHWKVAKNCNIHLPQTADGNIDFAFMEDIVHELEVSYLHELEKYLSATGLNNNILTDREKTYLSDFENLKWREFLVDDLFVKQKVKKLSYKAQELPKQPCGDYTLPCLTSSFMNQGLNYYVPRQGATILNNVISIPSNSDVYRAYYQPNDFTVLSDAYAISWKDESIELQDKQYLFLVACINKVTNLPIYSYKNKLGGWETVKNKHILLPVNANNQPDLMVMEQIISALQKSTIADVVNYTNQNISGRVVTLNNQNSGTNEGIQ